MLSEKPTKRSGAVTSGEENFPLIFKRRYTNVYVVLPKSLSFVNTEHLGVFYFLYCSVAACVSGNSYWTTWRVAHVSSLQLQDSWNWAVGPECSFKCFISVSPEYKHKHIIFNTFHFPFQFPFYYSHQITRRRPTEYETHMEINAYNILAANPWRKNVSERPRSRWKYSIEINLKYGVRVWTGFNYVSQDMVQWLNLMKTILNLRFHTRQETFCSAEQLAAFQERDSGRLMSATSYNVNFQNRRYTRIKLKVWSSLLRKCWVYKRKTNRVRKLWPVRINKSCWFSLPCLYLRICCLVSLLLGEDLQISAISTHKHAPALCIAGSKSSAAASRKWRKEKWRHGDGRTGGQEDLYTKKPTPLLVRKWTKGSGKSNI